MISLAAAALGLTALTSEGLAGSTRLEFSYIAPATQWPSTRMPFQNVSARYWLAERDEDGAWRILVQLGAPDPFNRLQSVETLPVSAGVYGVFSDPDDTPRIDLRSNPPRPLVNFTVERGDWITLRCTADGAAYCEAAPHAWAHMFQ